MALPRILFVLGKGGVGRTTLSTALGLALAHEGRRTLVLQWAIADAIGPWFGLPPAGAEPQDVAENLAVANFSLQDSLRAYFVDHLHLGVLYRRVIRAPSVRSLVELSPGISEIFFLGELWWLTHLAKREAGLDFDHVVVDAPATGHAASLLDVPATLQRLGAVGPLALEVGRVSEMMADASQVGALVAVLPELLPAEETKELLPRVAERLRRPPLALVVNRSARGLCDGELPGALSVRAQTAVEALRRELRARVEVEGALDELARLTARGALSLPDLLGRSPLEVARALSSTLAEGL